MPNWFTEAKTFASVSNNSETLFDYAGKQDQIKAIEAKMGEPGFWDDNEAAQKTVAELKSLKSIVGPMNELTSVGRGSRCAVRDGRRG